MTPSISATLRLAAGVTPAKLAMLVLTLVALVFALFPQPAIAAYVPGVDGWSRWDTPLGYDIYAVWVDTSSDNVFAVGKGGRFFSHDGTTWAIAATSTTSDLLGVWGSSPTDVFAVGSNGVITHYDGSTWETMPSSSSHLSSIWGSSANEVFAVGNQSYVMYYNGTTWTAMPIPSVQLRGVWGTSASDVYAVGNVGTILHYDGAAWTNITPSPSITSSHLYSVWGSSSTDVFAVGAGGAVCHFNGSSWTLMTSNTTSTLYSVWGSSASDVFAVGDGGLVLHYDGISWTQMPSGISKTLYGISGKAACDIAFAVGKDGEILRYVESKPPTVLQLEPAQGVQGDTLQFSITGNELGCATALDFGAGVTISSFASVDSSTITGSLTIDPLAATGPRDVSVTTRAGATVTAEAFAIHQAPPAVTVVDPAAGIQGAVLSITIKGSYLEGVTSLDFGPGITVEAFSSSHDCITANITIASIAAPGLRDITVATPGGDFTSPGAFTIGPAPPTLSSMAPCQGQMADSLTLILYGTYLTGATAPDFGPGIVVESFTVDSPSQITVHITIEAGADIGSRDITVSTPGGTATLAAGFLVTLPLPPTVTSVTPLSANQGESIDIVITGTDFTTVTSLSLGDGIRLNDFTVESDTEIRASITVLDSATSGVRDISVTNPGGTHALPGGFEVPPPSITSIDCPLAYQGDTLHVVITGKNLFGTSQVNLGPGITVESFTVDSPDRITAIVRISKTAPEGDRDILVTTPNGTTALSGQFAIEEPDVIPVHTWILSGLIVGLITFRAALFGLRRRRQEDD